MANVTPDTITDVVCAALGRNGDITDRQRVLMTALIRHLHGFCKEVNLQHGEFIEGCEFLRRAGDTCERNRQEFILLADILGIEVLVDMQSNPARGDVSESTILGPFYRENPPALPKGASIIQKHFPDEETARYSGTIRDAHGDPLPGVMIDVWQGAPNGVYENLDPEQPDYNLRGRFESDENGEYAFVGVRPVPYPIPTNETAGELLRFMGHHANRPGHMHYILSKDGYRRLISQIYDGSSKWLDDDAVFAVKDSLVGQFEKGDDTDLKITVDFVLTAEAEMAPDVTPEVAPDVAAAE